MMETSFKESDVSGWVHGGDVFQESDVSGCMGA